MSDNNNAFLDILAAPLGGASAVERTSLDTKVDQLGDFIGQERDAPYVTEPDVFEGMTREEMLSQISSLDTGMLGDSSQAYHAVAGKFNLAWGLATLKNIAGGAQWTGTAADAANAAVARMATPVSDTHASLQTIGVKLQQASSAAGDVKPQVQSLLSNLEALPLMLSGADAAAMKEKQEQERRAAARVLEQIYKPTFVETGTNVPSIVPPEEIAGPGGGGGTSGAYGFGGGSGNTSAAPGTGTGAPGSGAGNPGTDAAAAETANTQAAAANPLPGQGSAAGGANAPASTTPSATMNGPNGTNGSGSGGSNVGGTGGGSGSGSGSGIVGTGAGHGSRAGGSGFDGYRGVSSNRSRSEKRDDTGNGMVGSALPPGLAAGAGAAAGAAASAGGTVSSTPKPGAGHGPMGMPMGRGAGAGKDEDTEHETPSYLITVENGNELVGDIAPVAPPVIGA